jgi:hypothetical protein
VKDFIYAKNNESDPTGGFNFNALIGYKYYPQGTSQLTFGIPSILVYLQVGNEKAELHFNGDTAKSVMYQIEVRLTPEEL